MRTLKFNRPYKINKTRVEDGKLFQFPDAEHYSRFSTITTKYGLVTASELKWATNTVPCICTLFSTSINGYGYSAWLEEAHLSDRNIKWMATNFIKQLQKENL